MYNTSDIDISLINTITFDSTEIPASASVVQSNSFRLTAADLAEMPDDTKDPEGLRRRLTELLHEKFRGNYLMLEAECDIKRDTFQKIQRGKRSVTYTQLAKFCVGARVSMDEAHDLFLMMGHELSCSSKPDYILLCELKNGGDICEYDEDMRAYCNVSVFADADKVSE